MQIKVGLLAFCWAVLLCVGTANADNVGTIGTVAGLQINTVSADTYLQFHGRMYVKNSAGNLDEYRWGGTSCGTRLLTENHFTALHRALDNKQMQIEPIYQSGQGDILCLVGFTMVPKKNLKLGIP